MAKNTLLRFPFEFVQVETLGILFYPIVSLELKTVFGWKKFDFLVDTGADLTTLPSTILPYLGLKESNLRKSKTVGVGGIEVETLEAVISVQFGMRKLQVHTAITKDSSTPFLLGRKDIFEEKFGLILDSVGKQTILKEN